MDMMSYLMGKASGGKGNTSSWQFVTSEQFEDVAISSDFIYQPIPRYMGASTSEGYEIGYKILTNDNGGYSIYQATNYDPKCLVFGVNMGSYNSVYICSLAQYFAFMQYKYDDSYTTTNLSWNSTSREPYQGKLYWQQESLPKDETYNPDFPFFSSSSEGFDAATEYLEDVMNHDVATIELEDVSANDIYWVRIRDLEGEKQDYFYSSDSIIIIADAESETVPTGVVSASVDSEGKCYYTSPSLGIYVSSIKSGILTIHSHYTPQCGLISGTYKAVVYKLISR